MEFKGFVPSRRLTGAATTMVLALMLGGCASLLSGGDKALPTFDLTAPREFSVPRIGAGQLVVGGPTALQVLDTERIVVEPAPGQITYLEKAQWADRLPALFQARLIEAFENGSRSRSVARADSGVTADYILLTNIRTFGIQITAAGAQAVVEVSAKIVGNSSGRIVSARVFQGRAAAAGTDGPQATLALDTAADQVFIEIVRWASTR